jgi:hypothetical protein
VIGLLRGFLRVEGGGVLDVVLVVEGVVLMVAGSQTWEI